jgi:hypothetical protein
MCTGGRVPVNMEELLRSEGGSYSYLIAIQYHTSPAPPSFRENKDSGAQFLWYRSFV